MNYASQQRHQESLDQYTNSASTGRLEAAIGTCRVSSRRYPLARIRAISCTAASAAGSEWSFTAIVGSRAASAIPQTPLLGEKPGTGAPNVGRTTLPAEDPRIERPGGNR